MSIPNDLPKGDEARADERHAGRKDAPLDGSTSGTIGGGGRETGGPTARRTPGDMPPVHPEDAASGRLAPDPLAGTENTDPPSLTETDSVRPAADAREPDRK